MKLTGTLLPAVFFLVVSAICFPGSVVSGDYLSPKVPFEEPVLVDDSFEFDFKFNGWMAQLNTNIANANLGYQSSLFISLGDILGNLDWMVPFGADLRWGQFGFMPDVIAMKISGASPTPRGVLFTQTSTSMKLLTANLPFYYRIVDKEDLQIDLLAGARFLWVDLDVAFSGGFLGTRRGVRRASNDIQAWNGIGGIRIHQDLNDKVFYNIYGDLGAGESDLTWQVQGDIGYRLKENITTSIGYRYLTFDMSRRANDVGLTSSGVIISTTVEF